MIAAAFQATYSDWKVVRTRKCVQIVLEVPIELSNEAYEVLGGMPNPAEEIWVGVARLDPKVGHILKDKEHRALPPTPAEEDTSKTVTDEKGTAPVHPPARALPQKVWRFCADIRFRRWAVDMGKVDNTAEATVAEWVRQFCKVSSRADILPGTEAEQLWNIVESAYGTENRV